MFGITRRIERAARKGAAFSAAAVLGAVGTAFLTAAAFMVLTELASAVFAASVLGLIYVGGAALVLALGLRKAPRQTGDAPRPASGSLPPGSVDPRTGELSPLQLVVLSFLQGLEQGRAANRDG